MRLPAPSFFPAWSLRQDREEEARLALLCLDPRGLLLSEPAIIGTVRWWAAVDGGTLPVRVRTGRILRGEGRPGEPDPLVVLRERDGTETTHPAHADRQAPWRLAGRQARITTVLHPTRPGTRGGSLSEVPILFELLAPPAPQRPLPRV